jgi:hypothetical protein
VRCPIVRCEREFARDKQAFESSSASVEADDAGGPRAPASAARFLDRLGKAPFLILSPWVRLRKCRVTFKLALSVSSFASERAAVLRSNMMTPVYFENPLNHSAI